MPGVNRGEMRTVTGRTAFFAAIGALVVCIALFSMGCNGSGASREKMEEIDKALRTGTSRLTETTAFVAALEEFDFENAAFLEGALNTLDQSRDAAQALLASIDELQALSYGGGLSSLEGYVEEYSTATVEAVEELEAIYTGLQGILQAIEPVLREEAVITQLEEPGSDAELLGRLQRLEAALDTSLVALAEVEVPALLVEYKSLFTDILTTLSKLVGDLVATASGRSPNVNMEENPDFLRMQELMAGYIPTVENLYDSLKITGIDLLIERVELEINDLYMEVERQ